MGGSGATQILLPPWCLQESPPPEDREETLHHTSAGTSTVSVHSACDNSLSRKVVLDTSVTY